MAFTGVQLSVSDYANHNYIPDPSKLTPEVINLCRNILRGDKAAAVDMPIAVYIGQMALASSRECQRTRCAQHTDSRSGK